MLEIEGLSAGYGGIPVLNGVTIRIETGEFAAIVGPNGAGKTTLFKTISGIVRSMAGRVFPRKGFAGVSCSRRTSASPTCLKDARCSLP
jgi:ABC-type branched-subunit amino acid transport system ATPase component